MLFGRLLGRLSAVPLPRRVKLASPSQSGRSASGLTAGCSQALLGRFSISSEARMGVPSPCSLKKPPLAGVLPAFGPRSSLLSFSPPPVTLVPLE